MTPKDWTLLVVAAAKGRPLSPVQLQKSLFLLGRNLGVKQLHTEIFYDFRAYDYGPFNRQVYNDAKQLRDEGLIMISPDAGVRYRDYGATPSGLETASTLRATLDSAVTRYLDAIVEWVRSLSFTALVQAIYRDYPDMKANSVFRD
jgi:uncharacterized phage-associated protein